MPKPALDPQIRLCIRRFIEWNCYPFFHDPRHFTLSLHHSNAYNSITVLVRLVPPATALILELGIDIPNYWARSGKVYPRYPWVSLLAGLLLLVLFCWSIWRLTR